MLCRHVTKSIAPRCAPARGSSVRGSRVRSSATVSMSRMPSLLRLLFPDSACTRRSRARSQRDIARARARRRRTRSTCCACAIRARGASELSVDERGARLTLPLRASLVVRPSASCTSTATGWSRSCARTRSRALAPLVRGETALLPLRGVELAVALVRRPLRARAPRRTMCCVFQRRPTRDRRWRRAAAPRAARFLRSAGARRRRPLAAALPAGPAARAVAGAPEDDVLAMGLAGARRRAGAGPGAGAGAAIGVRVRAGARALPPDPRRPLAARSGARSRRAARTGATSATTSTAKAGG